MTREEAAAVLGVHPDSDAAAIKRRVHELSRAHHPDLGPPSERIERTGRMHVITEAYRTMSQQPVPMPEAKQNIRRDNVRDLAGAASVAAKAFGVEWLAKALAVLAKEADKK